MFENGAVFKSPDVKTPNGKIVEGKIVILLHLHGDVFCLLEIANGQLNIVRAEKWEYSSMELPRRLEDYQPMEGGRVSIEAHAEKPVEVPVKDSPKFTPKPETKVAPKESRFKK